MRGGEKEGMDFPSTCSLWALCWVLWGSGTLDIREIRKISHILLISHTL